MDTLHKRGGGHKPTPREPSLLYLASGRRCCSNAKRRRWCGSASPMEGGFPAGTWHENTYKTGHRGINMCELRGTGIGGGGREKRRSASPLSDAFVRDIYTCTALSPIGSAPRGGEGGRFVANLFTGGAGSGHKWASLMLGRE